ncbi:polyphenol oxidase family protein [Egicoccus sp. AB-alg2]|uniref:polyphenol oxidase family protein n=1 Tax=Egicoccus sp. AB-alg2 TaxID=3242693 RepID=UPI00359CC3E3
MPVLVLDVDLADGVGAWFTGRDRTGSPPGVGAAGNLSHRRPHQPAVLARTRAEVGRRTGRAPATWHTMHQVHGARVGVVDDTVPPGAELRGVDALVTRLTDRTLAVSVADCVPVLLAGATTVAAVHAGRRGVQTGVVTAALDAMAGLGDDVAGIRAAIGPAIGGCCYEVPADLHTEVVAEHPAADARTTWGTHALDLAAAVHTTLEKAGVGGVQRLATCTRCDPDARWFSHRADPTTGRQFGLVVRERATA